MKFIVDVTRSYIGSGSPALDDPHHLAGFIEGVLWMPLKRHDLTAVVTIYESPNKEAAK